jgi:Fe-S cluster assembly iron-binding protein IscA
MLTITDTARDKFKELMQEQPGRFLRVVFEGFG